MEEKTDMRIRKLKEAIEANYEGELNAQIENGKLVVAVCDGSCV